MTRIHSICLKKYLMIQVSRDTDPDSINSELIKIYNTLAEQTTLTVLTDEPYDLTNIKILSRETYNHVMCH